MACILRCDMQCDELKSSNENTVHSIVQMNADRNQSISLLSVSAQCLLGLTSSKPQAARYRVDTKSRPKTPDPENKVQSTLGRKNYLTSYNQKCINFQTVKQTTILKTGISFIKFDHIGFAARSDIDHYIFL